MGGDGRRHDIALNVLVTQALEIGLRGGSQQVECAHARSVRPAFIVCHQAFANAAATPRRLDCQRARQSRVTEHFEPANADKIVFGGRDNEEARPLLSEIVGWQAGRLQQGHHGRKIFGTCRPDVDG